MLDIVLDALERGLAPEVIALETGLNVNEVRKVRKLAALSEHMRGPAVMSEAL